jgi:hypothetical protein
MCYVLDLSELPTACGTRLLLLLGEHDPLGNR